MKLIRNTLLKKVLFLALITNISLFSLTLRSQETNETEMELLIASLRKYSEEVEAIPLTFLEPFAKALENEKTSIAFNMASIATYDTASTKQSMQRMAALNEKCATEYKWIAEKPLSEDLKNKPYTISTKPWVTEICNTILPQSKKYFKKVLEDYIIEKVVGGGEKDRRRDTVNSLNKGEKIMQQQIVRLFREPKLANQSVIDSLKANLIDKYTEYNISMPDFKTGANAPSSEEIKAAIEKSKSIANFPDDCDEVSSKAEEAIEKAMKSQDLELRKACKLEDWDIRKNALGTPIERRQYLHILAKHPNSDYCRYYVDLYAYQQHKGGGKYEDTYKMTDPLAHDDLYIVKCDTGFFERLFGG